MKHKKPTDEASSTSAEFSAGEMEDIFREYGFDGIFDPETDAFNAQRIVDEEAHIEVAPIQIGGVPAEPP